MYNQLLSKQNKNQALILSKFFKTNPGEYGENDCFLGIKVPIIRDIVKSTPLMSIEQLEPLISSKWHEVRMRFQQSFPKYHRRTKDDEDTLCKQSSHHCSPDIQSLHYDEQDGYK